MSEALREVAVVRQKSKSFALGVEPANIKEPRKLWREEIKIVSRACGSRRVETNPAGLCRRMVRRSGSA